MASLLILLDDITAVLDDVAVLTKVASKKTATLAGDDLAVGANQVTGVSANRELPVVWKVFKGSLRNKFFLVPVALLLSAFAPWAITPLLVIGGIYLCFEGAEKVFHKFFVSEGGKEHNPLHTQAVAEESVDMVALEKQKISGAVRTDFILSAEIVIIALGTMTNQPFWMQVLALSTIALLMTVVIYGLVAVIVKFDDFGHYLMQKSSRVLQVVGNGFIQGAPWFMRALSILGTAAMFTVGGSILAHAIPSIANWVARSSGLGALGIEALVGVIAGFAAVGVWLLISKLRRK